MWYRPYGVDICGVTKEFGTIRPVRTSPPFRWSLDMTLSYALSPSFLASPSLSDRTSVLAFLLALAPGARGSELQALVLGSDFLVFSLWYVHFSMNYSICS